MPENIKMIVCDVDGTLLSKGAERLSSRAVDVINRVMEKGIAFAAASGRSYADLKKIFSGVSDKMYYICYDGALMIKNGETVFDAPIPETVLKKTEELGGVNLLYCGKEKSSRLQDELFRVYKIVLPNDFTSARLSLYAESNRLLSRIYQGKEWVEYVKPGIDKSAAIKFLQDRLNISRDDTACFGDNYNDIGMLKCGAYSYAMQNAATDVKRLAKYKTDDVIDEIVKNWL